MAGVMAQPVFRTILPSAPVVEGEPFTIQYIWEDVEQISNFRVESFNGLTLVNGPISYKSAVPGSTGTSQMQNFIFTLVSNAAGTFSAPQANAVYKGKTIQSIPAQIIIISAKQALAISQKQKLDQEYFLKKGEDPYRKINENLFLKLTVDRRSAYVGEPLVATYKLYSRLESRSDIIRNPGFYGFTVQDMANLADHIRTVETIDGKDFDVHLIRQVQLYPLQEGSLTIDAMGIKNKVRFSVSEKNQQKLSEGLLNSEETGPAANDEYENMITCSSCQVTIKPLSGKNRPDSFSGAVGSFQVSARLKKSSFCRNEEGSLELEIKGKGNFIQLTAPVIKWPDGIEGFEAVQTDSLNKHAVPLEGKRVFRYSFVSTRPGNYIIPALSYTYFDPATGSYRQAFTSALPLQILDRDLVVSRPAVDGKNKRRNQYEWFLLLFLPLLFLLWKKRSRKEKAAAVMIDLGNKKTVEELMSGGKELAGKGVGPLCVFLREKILFFLDQEFGNSGTGLNKNEVTGLLEAKGVDRQVINELLELISYSEVVIYTGVAEGPAPSELLDRTIVVLSKLEARHSAYL